MIEEGIVARSGDRVALDRLLGGPEMAWLVERVRGRILAAGNLPLAGVVQLNQPTDVQRAAAVRLVGRPRRGGATLRVDLAVVEEILRRGPWPAGLADAVETLSGPVVDRAAERARETAVWDAARDALLPAAAGFPGLAEWWHSWCAAGGLKRVAGAEAARRSLAASPAVAADLVRQVTTVLALLPATRLPLAVLARDATGDAHGLDVARPLGRLTAAVVRAAFLPGSSEEVSVRDGWAAAGVVLSSVASTVLSLGVPGVTGVRSPYRPDDPPPPTEPRATMEPGPATGTVLEAMRAARMPVVLTLDQVRSGGVAPLHRDGVVHVCENPTVVEVVAERWARTPPRVGASGGHGPVLVCTSGQPSTAVVELLVALTADGARVRYHGDFDWAGLRIARALSAHVAWEPWRFSASDYREAVARGGPSRALTGSPAHSPWDPELAAAMADAGLAVEEEAVADLLAGDVIALD